MLTRTKTGSISAAILLIRIMTGLILFVAGAGKVMGWFGGMGMQATLEAFKTGSNINAFWAYVSSYAEFIGGLLLMIGLFTRVAALFLFINMLVAVIIVGTKNFFMGGAAYPALLMINSLAIILSGPMEFSMDALINKDKNVINT